MTPETRRRLFVLYDLVLGVVFLWLRWVWQADPSLVTCAIFWAGAALSIWTWPFRAVTGFTRGWASVLMLGSMMNAAVTLANGGFMPVTPLLLKQDSDSLWVVERSDHLLRPLGDLWLGFSVGDLLIAGSLLIACAGYIFGRGDYALREAEAERQEEIERARELELAA